MDKKLISHIAIEINNSCNQDCIFCYNHIPHTSNIKNSDYNNIKKLLKTLYSQATIQNITFTGGEPMLESRLAELVLYAKMKKSLTTIISNGTLFTPERTNDLLIVKNDLFQLPIHSHASSIHDSMTGLLGSHRKSTEAIVHLSKSGALVVAVIVLTKKNINFIAETIQFINDLGIKQISVDRYNIGGKYRNKLIEILPQKSELIKAYQLINAAGKENGLTITSNVCTPHCVLDPRAYPHIRFGNCAAEPLHFPLTTNITGDLRVCNHSPIIAGNIFKQNIFDILESNYVKSWNNNIPEICSNCSLWESCRGGCRAAAEQSGLDNSHPDPVIRIFEQHKHTN